MTLPSETPDGLHAPGLRFGDPRVMALFSAMVGFAHLIVGFDNPSLTRLVSTILDRPYSSARPPTTSASCGEKGSSNRSPETHRCLVTPYGRRVAVLFTKAHRRVLAPGFAWLHPALPQGVAQRSPLAVAWRQFDMTLITFIEGQTTAA